jgi:hypothetical protein
MDIYGTSTDKNRRCDNLRGIQERRGITIFSIGKILGRIIDATLYSNLVVACGVKGASDLT